EAGFIGAVEIPGGLVEPAIGEIAPSGVVPLDHFDLPGTRQMLDPLLLPDGLDHRRVRFVPDQPRTAVAGGEASEILRLMLPHSADEIARPTGVERPVVAAGQEVDRDQAVGRDHAELFLYCSHNVKVAPSGSSTARR